MYVNIYKFYSDAILPEYKTPGAAGFDLAAYLSHVPGIRIKPGERKTIPTGLGMEIPDGLELQIRSRSGLAHNRGIIVLNSPGTIDSDYRGEIQVILYNSGKAPFTVQHGDRIAQGVISPIIRADFKLVEDLSETERGSKGFGSTGISDCLRSDEN